MSSSEASGSGGKKPGLLASVLHGIDGTGEDKNNDYLCPICVDVISEAHITRCGHTFCYQCIIKSIEINGRCPACSSSLSLQDTIPNFVMNELVSKYKTRVRGLTELKSGKQEAMGDMGNMGSCDGLRDFLTAESANLTLPDVNVMLEVLTQRKHLLEAESCVAQNKLLYEFLKHLLQQKEEQRAQLLREVTMIKGDMGEVEGILKDVKRKCPKAEDIRKSSDTDSAQVSAIRKEMIDLIDMIDSNMPKSNEEMMDESSSHLALRRKRMHAHFEDFVHCYFDCRAKELLFGSQHRDTPTEVGHGNTSGLEVFRENLVKFSRYSSLRALATLNYSSDIFNNSTIVSSIEFDKDNEFFAIAGVTKRIKVFDYGAVVRDIVDIHYPCVEMVSSSKISCVSWNSYHKSMLASSDYEGTVTVWDATTGQRTKAFHEHEKRCWSVDFNDVDSRLIASGSDDARVKLWSLNIDHSVASLEAKANVCCVKFNPRSSCHLAFGSADHCVHYYDLRNMKEALCVFKGHRKAVSYVKFINKEDIVSASTDSQLKMWNINNPHCLRSFVGHVNEKNFVGLATDGDYVACGSENNALYIYYKGLTKQLFSYKFDAVRSVLEMQERREEDLNEFVSAVCWRQMSNVVVAANSQGIIKVLELVVGPKIKKAETKIFWDLSSEFNGVAVVGLGKMNAGINVLEEIHEGKENVRAAAAAGCRALDSHDIKDIVLENFGDAEAAAEGAYLSTFISQEFKAKDSRKEVPQISLHGSEGANEWKVGRIKAEAQNWARKLTDTPANHMTPAIFCAEVASALENHNTVVQVHDQKWAEEKGMGSYLSVSRGSEVPPKFLEVSYKGSANPKDPPMVFVGKGVTFDTGGISIKGGLNMELMRGDMGGAACIVAMVKAVAELKVPRNIVALIPLTENMPSGKATKPGDVVYAMNGKSITIDNTDAEGRLILADALCYSQEFNPRFVVDVATLTGAMKMSLSSAATGVWTNDMEIFEQMQKAGTMAGDRVWRFPLWQMFSDRVKKSGRSADMNNMPKGGKGGGSCFAASFLQEFVGEKTPWMHMDIAGVMDLLGSEDSPYLPSSGMSGRPTRTLIQFVQQLSH